MTGAAHERRECSRTLPRIYTHNGAMAGAPLRGRDDGPGTGAGWTVVVPFKPAAVGKSRLTHDDRLVRAIALDTVAAALGCARVARVIAVTADRALAADLAALGAHPRLEEAPLGIAAALALGLSDVPVADARAALLGDLPALTAADLDAALDLAVAHERAYVADAEGTGTTLVTARGGAAFQSFFGAGSASRHAAAGLVLLPVPAGSSLRRDVDDVEQLAEARAYGLGARTLAVLDAATKTATKTATETATETETEASGGVSEQPG